MRKFCDNCKEMVDNNGNQICEACDGPITDIPTHFYVHDAGTWLTRSTMSDAIIELTRIHEVEKSPFQSYCVWEVPGDVTTNYRINFYAPQVEGAHCLGVFDYPVREKKEEEELPSDSPIALLDDLIEGLEYGKILLEDEDPDSAYDELGCHSGELQVILNKLRDLL